MKKTIIIDATGSSRWIGGLYYKKNILYSLTQNEEIIDNFYIVVITENLNKGLFEEFENKVKVHYLSYKYQKERVFKLKLFCVLNKSSFIFPCFDETFCKRIKATGIYWIPDFQHYHLPQNFSEEERSYRRSQHMQIVESSFPLVLSSNDCRNDFREYCSSNKKNVFVVPFVSYIEKDIKKLTSDYESEILKKHMLENKRYILICNQFWRHKNHTIVLETIKKLANRGECDYIFVFTGKLQDNKDPEYIQKIKEKFEQREIKENSLLLGFINRKEQLVLMKNAEMILQPSLFEGWGTVLEDAKVLDKTVLLSDISIHREQRNGKSILFNPTDAEELAKTIHEEMKKKHESSINIGIEDMKKRAKLYSVEFQKMLNA